MPPIDAPLINATELMAVLDEPRLRIADVRWYLGDGPRGRRGYEFGHIPGAIYVDLERDLSAVTGPGRHPLPEAAVFCARLSALRAAARYRGDEEPVDRVPGHIPGARNRPAATLLGADGLLLAPEQLRTLLEHPGDAVGRRMVLSCGSGVTACFGALAARVAGLPDPLLYPGSYSDWSSADMPITTGDESGEAGPGTTRASAG